ncbi:MAG: S41 family peptidase [Bacillota bacterium]
MFKKLWMIVSILSVLIIINGCSDTEEEPEENPYDSKPDTESVAFEDLADEYDVDDGFLDLHFYEDGVPYVDIEAFIDLLEGAIMTDEIETGFDDGVFTMTYTLEAGESEADIYEDTTLEFELDTEAHTVKVNRMAFFNGMSEETKTDFGEHLEVSDYEETTDDPVTIDMTEYDMNIMEEDGDILLPFNIANLFFSGSMYDVYYNGEKLYGTDTYQLMDDPKMSDTLNDTEKNDDSIPESLKDHTQDYLALSFDYFYGLKSMNGVEDYYDDLSDFEEGLEGSDTDHYRAIFDYAFTHDDIHTSPIMSGYYEDNLSFQPSFEDLGTRTTKYYETLYDDAFSQHCESDDDVTYSDDGSKALIKVDEFDEDTHDDFDETMQAIDNEGSVEDVVIDLSCNGGGVIGMMIQMFGYMTDDPVEFYSKNITDGSTSTTTYDVDIEARDYDFHLLTSPLTFSAANSMVSIAKDNDLATILGEPSSGGASSVMTNITPSGSILVMSSPEIMTDSNFDSIENGIDPDVEIPLQDIPDSQEVFDALP